MEMKNKLKIIITSLVPALFLVPFACAFQLFPPMISELLQTWFGGAIPPDYITRILLGLLIFIVFYYAAGFAFNKSAYGESKTNTFRWMVALLVAILTVLFLPQSLMDIYKSMFAMFTPVLVTIGLIVFARKVNKHHTQEGHIGAALAYAIGIALIGFVVAEASQFGIQDFNIVGWSFLDILQLLMFVLFVLFFINIFKAFSGGSKQRSEQMKANINDAEKDIKHQEKEKEETKKEEKQAAAETKKEEKIEKKETYEDIHIFQELKKLRELVVAWAATITNTNRHGDIRAEQAVLNELKRLRNEQAYRDKLERIKIKEARNLHGLVEGKIGRYTGDKKVVNINSSIETLIKTDSHLNAVFEKILDYISGKVTGALETMKPDTNSIIAAIDQALAIKARTIKTEQQEVIEEDQERKNLLTAEEAREIGSRF